MRVAKPCKGGSCMSDLTFEDLKNNSVHLFPTSKAVWPQYNFAERPVIMRWSTIWEYEKRYCMANNVVTFVHFGNLYVTFWEDNIIEVLESKGFKYKKMPVNFSEGEYPKDARLFWHERLRVTKSKMLGFFQKECMKFCERNGIRAISDDYLKKCYEIPVEGIKCISIRQDPFTYYPPAHWARMPLDMHIKWRLKAYDVHNGIVTFVTNDGRQMIASMETGILSDLEDSGREHEPRFVPLSNGESVSDAIKRDLMFKGIFI